MNDTVLTPTSARPRPVRASTGAVATTVACVLPVFLLGGLAVQMGADIGFSPAGLGVAVAVYFGVSALASVPSGRLVERYGPAVVARCGILLAAGSMLAVAALARSYPVLVGLLALSAAANALGQLASNAALAQHVPARRQGLSFGVKQAAIPVSTLLAGAAVPTVALTAGWRWAFVVAAGAALTTLPLVPRQEPGPARGAGGGRTGRATGALVVVGAAATLAAAAANALGTFLVDSAAARGLSPGLAGLTLTLGSAVCVVARVGAGWLADRRADGHVALIAAMLVVGAVGLGLLALTGAVPLVAGVVLGFGLGWAWPGLMNFAVVRLHPQAPATATSITQTGVYAGGCLGPLTLGPLAAHLGYPTMWSTAAVSMLLAAALMLVGSRLLTAAGNDRSEDQLVRSAM
ncbi:MFS transporter [Micromonospora sp. NPDC093244]|uniref:MFS transporter n=1 Tax=unclassified Micromonospora TaxID=2617518 RepID=UPI00341BA44F